MTWNLYAMRDRMVDYYMLPFAAPDDKSVLAALAQRINCGETKTTDPLVQAPHHFELWKLAEIDDQGAVKASLELLAGCDSLVRHQKPNLDA